MHNWSLDRGFHVYRSAKPSSSWIPLIHEEIDALGLGFSYRIEWPSLEQKSEEEHELWPEQAIVRVWFEGVLSDEQQSSIESLVSVHDGSGAALQEEANRIRVSELIAQNQVALNSARQKRLAGEALTQEELAAIADMFIFQTGGVL